MSNSDSTGLFEPQTVKLIDGRKLTYFDNGVNSAAALIMHHGTPGLGDLWGTWLDAALAKGVRAVSFSRAGYPGSDGAPGRNVSETGLDFEQLLSRLGITEFVSIGWSGGGPFALRSTFSQGSKGADLLAGVAPYEEMGADWFIGLNESDTPESIGKLTESFESALESSIEEIDGIEEVWTEELFTKGVESRSNYSDFVGLYAIFNKIAAKSLVSAVRPDITGYAEDNHMIFRPWGFSVSQVTLPVSIWNGALDKAVSPNMAKWQHEQIKGSTIHILEDQNHFTPMVENMAEILDSAIAKLVS